MRLRGCPTVCEITQRANYYYLFIFGAGVGVRFNILTFLPNNSRTAILFFCILMRLHFNMAADIHFFFILELMYFTDKFPTTLMRDCGNVIKSEFIFLLTLYRQVKPCPFKRRSASKFLWNPLGAPLLHFWWSILRNGDMRRSSASHQAMHRESWGCEEPMEKKERGRKRKSAL